MVVCSWAALQLVGGLMVAAHLACGIAALVSYEDAPGCSTVWPFCIVAVVQSGLAILGLLAEARKSFQPQAQPQPQQSAVVNSTVVNMATQPQSCGCLSLALLIWGSIILAQTPAECKALYQSEAPYLWTYFLVSFAISVTLVAACCCVASGHATVVTDQLAPHIPQNQKNFTTNVANTVVADARLTVTPERPPPAYSDA